MITLARARLVRNLHTPEHQDDNQRAATISALRCIVCGTGFYDAEADQ